MSINWFVDIVGPLPLGKKGVWWKHHCQPISQLIKITFSQKQLIESLWNFIQIFGFLMTKNWYSQEKILFWGKCWNILKSRAFWSSKSCSICSIPLSGWSCTIVVFMILQTPHLLGKSLSQVLYENTLNQSDCKIF